MPTDLSAANISTKSCTCTYMPLTPPGYEEHYLPDSGTTLTYMPEDIIYALLNYIPEALVHDSETWEIDCSIFEDRHHPLNHMTIDFGFNENLAGTPFRIRVPLREALFRTKNFTSNEEVCLLGISPSYGEFNILGDSFLRSSYGMSIPTNMFCGYFAYNIPPSKQPSSARNNTRST